MTNARDEANARQSALNNDRKRKKIAFFVNDMNFFFSHRLKIAEAAISEGYEVVLICPNGNRIRQISEIGVRHIPLSLSRGRGSILKDIFAIMKFFKILKNDRPSLVHLVTSKPVILGGIVTRLLGIPAVAAISGLGHIFISDSLKMRFLRQIVAIGYRLALHRDNAWAIFQNDDNKALFTKLRLLKQEPAMIRGMGVDLSLFDPTPTFNIVPKVLMPCRMLSTKGVYEFVEACKKIKQSGLEAEFILMGNPDPANPASIAFETLKGWNESGVITWLKHSDDIAVAMRDSDIIALPSYNEGFPKTLIDAAAAGRPVVTTNVTGCRDAVVASITGLLAEPRNAESLAKQLIIMLQSEAMRLRMGRAARVHAEKNFSIEKIASEHLDLYRHIISTTENPAAK